MSEEQEVPQREQQTMMTCCCRMKWVHPDGTVNYDSCWGITSGPDEPICPGCVQQGHPERENFDPIIKPAPAPFNIDENGTLVVRLNMPIPDGFVNYKPPPPIEGV